MGKITEKKWTILPEQTAIANKLQESLKINKTICEVLSKRGITNFDSSKLYFRPSLTQLHSPWLMKDMDKAVARILQAIQQHEKILVYGDYDVDGTTSVSAMFLFLKSIYHTQQIDFYIPHRYKEGYGVSQAGIDFAIENNFGLIISLDCGIKSIELVQYAADNNIDFIICDHHLPDEDLPVAYAILNPKQKDCPYPYKELCGCGVGYKLICALTEKLDLPEDTPHKYLDLLACAIAADIVPMTGENRILSYYGLKKVNEKPQHGIKALIQLSGTKPPLNISNLVFVIAPRVNAAGRMDDARKAVNMFISTTEQEGLSFAEMLHTDNLDRREADANTSDEALAILEASPELLANKSTLLYAPHWHKGVVGIVASRLIDYYYKPTIILTKSGDVVAGSARSVYGFNVYEAIHACREHLLGYGGHFYAAGMTLEESKVPAFREKFEEVVSSSITSDLLEPNIFIDAPLAFSDINIGFINIINQMEPFGPENLRPSFISRQVQIAPGSKVLKEKHIRFVLKQGNTSLVAIGFNFSHKIPLLQAGGLIDIVYTVETNEWNGNKTIQLKLIDCKPTQEPSLN
jgi:single-stranded-DNA-specific exonuclease